MNIFMSVLQFGHLVYFIEIFNTPLPRQGSHLNYYVLPHSKSLKICNLYIQFASHLEQQTAEIKNSSPLQMKRSQAYVPSTSYFHACINKISSFSRYGKNNNINNFKNENVPRVLGNNMRQRSSRRAKKPGHQGLLSPVSDTDMLLYSFAGNSLDAGLHFCSVGLRLFLLERRFSFKT